MNLQLSFRNKFLNSSIKVYKLFHLGRVPYVCVPLTSYTKASILRECIILFIWIDFYTKVKQTVTSVRRGRIVKTVSKQP